MNVLTGYIVKEVIKGSLIALILLLTLFNLFTFSDELKDLGKGSYDLIKILKYLALTSPTVLYELIPSSALLGSLFVVGSMANNREIVAMRAAGLSVFWIIRAVMLAGVILVIFAILIGEFVAPEAERRARVIKTTAQNNQIVISARYGLWLREGKRFINVRKIEKKGVLADIYAYTINEQGKLTQISHIDQANYIDKKLWRMNNIRRTEFANQVVLADFTPQLDWKTSINPNLLKAVVVKSDNMSLYDLFMYINFLKKNNQKSHTYELAFWSRLINPLITFVMLLVSIPFVLGIKRGVGTGGRIMIGIIIGMTFNIFDQIAGHLGLVYGLNPMIMAILPSTIVLFSALYAIKKVR